MDFNSALARLLCCLSKGFLKRGFLDMYLITFSESAISKLQNRRGSFLFLKMFEVSTRFEKCSKKLRKRSFVSEIIAYELVSLNCLY